MSIYERYELVRAQLLSDVLTELLRQGAEVTLGQSLSGSGRGMISRVNGVYAPHEVRMGGRRIGSTDVYFYVGAGQLNKGLRLFKQSAARDGTGFNVPAIAQALIEAAEVQREKNAQRKVENAQLEQRHEQQQRYTEIVKRLPQTRAVVRAYPDGICISVQGLNEDQARQILAAVASATEQNEEQAASATGEVGSSC